MPIIEQEAKVAGTREDGSQIILPEVRTTLTNTVTGEEYVSEEHVAIDVADPLTPTAEEHIKRDVEIRLFQGLEVKGET